jgi:hypothetical protein
VAEIEKANQTQEKKGGAAKENPKTAEQLLLEMDNDEDDETEEYSDTSICESSQSETELNDLLDNNKKAADLLERENLYFSEKLVC